MRMYITGDTLMHDGFRRCALAPRGKPSRSTTTTTPCSNRRCRISARPPTVMWARKRQPDQVAYGVALGHERFGPRELLDQAVAAERAGFDLVCCSDHLAPWWEGDERGARRAGLAVSRRPAGPDRGSADHHHPDASRRDRQLPGPVLPRRGRPPV